MAVTGASYVDQAAAVAVNVRDGMYEAGAALGGAIVASTADLRVQAQAYGIIAYNFAGRTWIDITHYVNAADTLVSEALAAKYGQDSDMHKITMRFFRSIPNTAVVLAAFSGCGASLAALYWVGKIVYELFPVAKASVNGDTNSKEVQNRAIDNIIEFHKDFLPALIAATALAAGVCAVRTITRLSPTELTRAALYVTTGVLLANNGEEAFLGMPARVDLKPSGARAEGQPAAAAEPAPAAAFASASASSSSAFVAGGEAGASVSSDDDM